jgi:hypothetical protein
VSNRETGDAAATRAQLATLFELAAFCTEAKLAEAALQLAEKDYSGVVALTAQVGCRPSVQTHCPCGGGPRCRVT